MMMVDNWKTPRIRRTSSLVRWQTVRGVFLSGSVRSFIALQLFRMNIANKHTFVDQNKRDA